MPDLQIEQWSLSRLRPYERNPRKNDDAVPRMVEALQEFGFRIPLLVKSDGEIIDGHLRYKAAIAMGLATVPVIIADDMSDAQIRAFRIMINRSVTWAEWDEELLAAEIEALKIDNFDIHFTGFDAKELESFFVREANLPENGASEIDQAEFDGEKFDHECPRCKFKFND